ncbi:hypothetical protein FQV26_06525 [Planococcus sp. CPCC 101016]|uniref:TIGR04104 family putative zinc finger protein n=1 Tax=Planococcus sp. CPCC 101016 TaxID=2599617 RepID=UPI0011B759B7|nr:TIGR04104 family putative zinc finger protein [Planococcus sp. CPCC 101016]TWT07465.1 hypothetical protein FQV26_06525 [Planococcus sp. CPCC 101016]
MQRCEICQTSFTWKQISKSLWMAYKQVACPNCGRVHKVRFLSRLLASLLTVGPVFAYSFFSYPTSTQALLFGALALFLFIFLLLPYLMQYRLS